MELFVKFKKESKVKDYYIKELKRINARFKAFALDKNITIYIDKMIFRLLDEALEIKLNGHALYLYKQDVDGFIIEK